MELTINKSDVYYIRGKIIDIEEARGIFTISVTHPFTCDCEIKFHCESGHYYLLHPVPSIYEDPSKYNWIGLHETHPPVAGASAYYNTEVKCFYKKESGTESEWKHEDFKDIYYDNPNLFRKNSDRWLAEYFFFLRRYRSILHKEQLCEFSAYALHESRSVKNKQVERHPDDYFWVYDPDTFRAEKWDTESIDDLVKDIRPSRDCLQQLLKSYEDDDRDTKKEKWERRCETIKSTPKRLQNWLAEYDKLIIVLITLASGAIGAAVIKAIISMITSPKN